MALQQITLLLLLASEIITLDCDQYVQSQKDLNQHSRELLNAMGRQEAPEECLFEMPAFAFPMKRVLGSSKEDARMAVGLILQQISNIFQQNFTQAGWDVKVTERFQDILYQQSLQWKECCTADTQEARFKDPRVQLSLLTYFRKIDTFLNAKVYSLCAWEAVRQDVWRSCFSIALDQLIKRLHN